MISAEQRRAIQALRLLFGSLSLWAVADLRTHAWAQTAPAVSAGDRVNEVVVRGASSSDRARESAEAVRVVDIDKAKHESADLGEILRRTAGVGVRRTGGLGSSTQLSLSGMSDDQIRFFVDGVPLEFTGFVDISVVPVNLLERVELYSGVVPVRFGTDALGGAVNLVSSDDYERSSAGGSYEAGSFGTHRGHLQARHRFVGTPLVVTATSFLDYADNDYAVDVEVPNALGKLTPARVHRFHDAYRALGNALEVGGLDLPWAQRLFLRLHSTDTNKQLQHNQFMTRAFGEVVSHEQVHGVTLRYEHPLRALGATRVSAVGAYARRKLRFLDASRFVYDWLGQRVREKTDLGEVEAAQDSKYIEHQGLARLGLWHLITPEHQVRLVSTLTTASRAGQNRLHESARYIDPAAANQRLLTLVSGAEYEADLFEERVENVAFLKHYYYELSAEHGADFGSALLDVGFTPVRHHYQNFGVGEQLRVRVNEWSFAKASYEYALRLPESEQVFGNGGLTLGNYELEPERSHNANLGVFVADFTIGGSKTRGSVNAFVRDSNQLILALPLGLDRSRYHNLWSSLSKGIEAALGWTSTEEYLSVDGNVTFFDQVNTSPDGPFADFEGDRIPNRPWLYANASLRGQLRGVVDAADELSLTWHSNYVYEFFRSWESAGRTEYKLRIDSQLLHSAVLTYVVRGARTLSAALEIQNLTDERAYDFLGVQKPGRAAYFKATLSI